MKKVWILEAGFFQQNGTVIGVFNHSPTEKECLQQAEQRLGNLVGWEREDTTFLSWSSKRQNRWMICLSYPVIGD